MEKLKSKLELINNQINLLWLQYNDIKSELSDNPRDTNIQSILQNTRNKIRIIKKEKLQIEKEIKNYKVD